MSKFYYAFTRTGYNEPYHEFVSDIDCTSCEALIVKAFECDPVELFKLVSQYAIQTGESLYFEHGGSTREFWDGKLQEQFDCPYPRRYFYSMIYQDLPDSEQE